MSCKPRCPHCGFPDVRQEHFELLRQYYAYCPILGGSPDRAAGVCGARAKDAAEIYVASLVDRGFRIKWRSIDIRVRHRSVNVWSVFEVSIKKTIVFSAKEKQLAIADSKSNLREEVA